MMSLATSDERTFYTALPGCDMDQPGSHQRLLSTIEEDLHLEGRPSTPGGRPTLSLRPLLLSNKRLSALDPEMAGVKRLAAGLLARLCCFLPPSTRLQEHLIFGEANPAVVVASGGVGLVVAAYAAPLDCAVLLRFPAGLPGTERLAPGTHLLAINTYRRGGEGPDADLTPGPEAAMVPLSPALEPAASGGCLEYGNPLYEEARPLGPSSGSGSGSGGRSACALRYTGVYPIIADLVSDDARGLAMRKEAFEDAAWERVRRLGLEKFRSCPELQRDGRPSAADQPAGPVPVLRKLNKSF
mmetsp:Transcript_43511/g.112679  ORF Transcript_43511/g.112679 Transcript_43511/m.112679 type:complete len:299 (+) Transcript_43511:252-1148(+)